MKKTTFLALIFLINTNFLYAQDDYMKNRFTIGTYNFVMKPVFRRQADLSNYNNLNFNANLSFTYRGDDDPESRYLDGFFTDPFNYIQTFQNTLFDLYGNPGIPAYNKQKVFFERAKIIRGAMGQRSAYEAENHGTYLTKFPGYGYNYSQTGVDYTEHPDNGTVSGRRCITGQHTAGFMVYGLYENMEQINFKETDLPNKTDMKYYWSDNKEDGYFWVVKPRMRINVSDFNDPNKKELPVVIIEVIRFDGIKISYDEEFTIKVRNFGDYNGNYIGAYQEDFNNYIS